MKVLFDSQIFCLQRFGGVSRYFASLAQEMLALPGVEPRIVAPFHMNTHLEPLQSGLVEGRKVEWGTGARVFTQLAGILPGAWRAHRFKPDVLHRTYYHSSFASFAEGRNVVTVFDMIHEKHPQDFQAGGMLARMKARAVARADHVICISEHTRRDLLDLYDIPLERVSVTHLGYENLARLVPSASPESFRTHVLGSDSPYVLYVGKRGGYKNFAGLIRAYGASQWLREHFKLLCFGGGPWSAADRSLTDEARVTKQVHHVDGSDTVLADCYRNAELFVYPSLYEGFGLPPLEAMSLDCPVACSNTSSIPEVVGDAAVSFDPHDAASIREALETVLSSSSARAQLVQRGRQRKTRFSWRKCAEETIEAYRAALSV